MQQLERKLRGEDDALQTGLCSSMGKILGELHSDTWFTTQKSLPRAYSHQDWNQTWILFCRCILQLLVRGGVEGNQRDPWR